jgi:hypothetical protein
MIPAELLAQAQTVVASTLSALATIQRPVMTNDNSGGWLRTMVTVATDVPCRYSRVNVTPREVETEISVKAMTYWSFTFAAGSDVRSIDRILADGRTFEVVSGRSGSPSVSTRVIAQEMV